ncbi:uncharacterized protein SCHCODRAFT_01169151 [Schizophyllum commune H4-8]|nr:uncharacterized protein SCHCODRAFT_01169151 [Schizophyllum commune H4-8]KAI5894453.1 hypothetical protein SCHCODRAFT_01169151 [Schizophyllum commune H4-8]
MSKRRLAAANQTQKIDYHGNDPLPSSSVSTPSPVPAQSHLSEKDDVSAKKRQRPQNNSAKPSRKGKKTRRGPQLSLIDIPPWSMDAVLRLGSAPSEGRPDPQGQDVPLVWKQVEHGLGQTLEGEASVRAAAMAGEAEFWRLKAEALHITLIHFYSLSQSNRSQLARKEWIQIE